MTHASKYWADKLPQDKKAEFWTLVGVGFSGETAFARVEQRLGLVEHGLADLLGVSLSEREIRALKSRVERIELTE